MDTSSAVLFGLVAIIGINQVAVRTRLARDRSAVFWSLTFIDLVAGVLVLVLGLPGFAHVPVVSWVVGLLLVMHVAQNLMLRNGWQQEEREDAKAARDEERKLRRQDREARELAEADAEGAEPS